MTDKKPNPGTKEAQELGCTCPVVDNHYGKGISDGKGGVNFWMQEDCPLHNNKTPLGTSTARGASVDSITYVEEK